MRAVLKPGLIWTLKRISKRVIKRGLTWTQRRANEKGKRKRRRTATSSNGDPLLIQVKMTKDLEPEQKARPMMIVASVKGVVPATGLTCNQTMTHKRKANNKI